MYVDKRLDGVQAVQTLSRLNRTIPGKENPFVLDFVNDPEDIYMAFKPYYDTTSLQEASDPTKLEALKHELDLAQVYHWDEVESFARIFYRPPDQQKPADHALMHGQLSPAVDRFNAMEEEKRKQFRDKLGGYVRIYAFLSQIIPYGDPELEMLYSYGRFLLSHLPRDRDPILIKVDDEVALQYYRMEKVFDGEISLRDGDSTGVKSPTDVGTSKVADEKAPLSALIRTLNERFGTDFSEADRLFFQQIQQEASQNERFIQTALANPLDKFKLGIRKMVEDLMIQRMAQNDKIVTKYVTDDDFQSAAFPILAEAIFAAVREEKDAESKYT